MDSKRLVRGIFLPLVAPILSVGFATGCIAQEKPYFVTYSHDLEEPGNLEIETKTALAHPDGSTQYGATALELEYGVRAWWTSELYLDGQATSKDSTLFTGFRIENRVRPIWRELPVNPVLYVEFEDTSGADKTILEIVGHDGQSDLAEQNGEARREHQHEAELKLILSSNLKTWNISENFIAEKNLGHEPWEFGYALGVSRPLRLSAGSKACVFCRENFSAGLELYGGLGTTNQFGWKQTSQYLAPVLQFSIPKGPRIGFEPAFGLNANSVGVLWRFQVAYEIEQIFSLFRRNSH